jgi:hypothetical protein
MSDEIEIQMPLPLDSDGFLRRECPTCEREFKWLYSEESDAAPEDGGYYCPYCGVQAPTDAWWTKSQLDFATGIATKEFVVPELEKFQRNLSQMARRSGGLLDFKPGRLDVDEPDAPVEVDDMRRVDFPCHPSEPVKILEDWTRPVRCLICGKTAP